MKFFPQDWRSDEKLRLCSLAARGLWIEMLALMHRSERYGQLLISGRVPTDVQLAVLVGALPDEVTAMLAELEDAGVFSRAAGGTIYSRRMTRDHKKAEIARKNGKKGGNPSLSKQTGKLASDNLRITRPLNSEARGQKPEEANASSARGIGDGFDIVSLTSEIARLAGVPIPDHGKAADFQIVVRKWLDAGANSDLVKSVVAARSAGRSVTSLRYFDTAMHEAIASKKVEISSADALADSIIARSGKTRTSLTEGTF